MTSKYRKGTWIGHVTKNNRATQVWVQDVKYSKRRDCFVYDLCIDTAVIVRSETELDEIVEKKEIKDFGIFKPRK